MCHFERRNRETFTELEPFLTQRDPSKNLRGESTKSSRAHEKFYFEVFEKWHFIEIGEEGHIFE